MVLHRACWPQCWHSHSRPAWLQDSLTHQSHEPTAEHVGLQAIEDLPGEETPEVFGLHANADLTFRTLQARDRLQLFRDTRPAQMSRKAGASREDVVDKLAEDLLVKV